MSSYFKTEEQAENAGKQAASCSSLLSEHCFLEDCGPQIPLSFCPRLLAPTLQRPSRCLSSPVHAGDPPAVTTVHVKLSAGKFSTQLWLYRGLWFKKPLLLPHACDLSPRPTVTALSDPIKRPSGLLAREHQSFHP